LAAAAVPPEGIDPIAMEPIPVFIPGCPTVGEAEFGCVGVELAMVFGVYLEAGLVG
jgi:hypothetical protein